MGDGEIGPVLPEVTADLQNAADVAGENGLGAAGKDVLNFAQAESFRHVRLGQIVTDGGAATNFAFRKRNQFQTRNHFQKLQGLLEDMLAVAQMASIVLNGF